MILAEIDGNYKVCWILLLQLYYPSHMLCHDFLPVICDIEPGNTFRRYLLSLNSYQQLWHIKSDAFLLLVRASKSCMISIFFLLRKIDNSPIRM